MAAVFIGNFASLWGYDDFISSGCWTYLRRRWPCTWFSWDCSQIFALFGVSRFTSASAYGKSSLSDFADGEILVISLVPPAWYLQLWYCSCSAQHFFSLATPLCFCAFCILSSSTHVWDVIAVLQEFLTLPAFLSGILISSFLLLKESYVVVSWVLILSTTGNWSLDPVILLGAICTSFRLFSSSIEVQNTTPYATLVVASGFTPWSLIWDNLQPISDRGCQ